MYNDGGGQLTSTVKDLVIPEIPEFEKITMVPGWYTAPSNITTEKEILEWVSKNLPVFPLNASNEINMWKAIFNAKDFPNSSSLVLDTEGQSDENHWTGYFKNDYVNIIIHWSMEPFDYQVPDIDGRSMYMIFKIKIDNVAEENKKYIDNTILGKTYYCLNSKRREEKPVTVIGTNHTLLASKYKTKLAEAYVKKTAMLVGKKIEIYQIDIDGVEFEVVDYDKVPDTSWNTLAEPRTTIEKDGIERYIPIRVDTNTIDINGFCSVEKYRKIKKEYNSTTV